jgi:hypothetical protein
MQPSRQVVLIVALAAATFVVMRYAETRLQGGCGCK